MMNRTYIQENLKLKENIEDEMNKEIKVTSSTDIHVKMKLPALTEIESKYPTEPII